MDKSTIIRTIVLAVALINQALVMFGYSSIPYSSEEIEMGLTALFTTLATLWAWWKNNSFTKEAIEADKYMRQLKGKNKKIG